jgi:competence CoiA-like predicted nuclease
MCQERMIPKCGSLVVHHWAHKANDCDSWWEPETEWHRSWKRLVPDDQIEVALAGHQADIIRKDGTVVELQHSPISIDDIRLREFHYGRMVWLFDGQGITAERFAVRDRGTHLTFRWKHPRKTYGLCTKPVYIDFGIAIFRLMKLYLDAPPYGGCGQVLPPEFFVEWLKS